MTNLKILTLDIETSPNLADVWGLWNNNVSLNQLRASSYTLCWAAKWYGEKSVLFGAQWENDNFISRIYDLISDADVIVGYNQDHFDLKTLNKDFALEGWGPPAPYKSIDLYKVVKKSFRFPSNKLDYVVQQFGIGSKVKHEGHTLWVKVMAGDPRAQKQMEKYCKGDVYPLTEKLYTELLPWISNHPNRGLYIESLCTRCPNGVLTRRGFYYASTGKYQTYRCGSCGGYQRDSQRFEGVDVVGI